MRISPRHAQLLRIVRTHGTASVDELANALRVTPQTVRRDVATLSAEGVVVRFHGGVSVPLSTTENIEYRQRRALNEAAKQRIARAVAAEVPENCSLIINIGTTTEAIAKALLRHKGLRVITNNLNVAAILADNPECEVIVAGGVVRSRDRGVVGEATVDFISQFHVDIALIGISGIDASGTLRDYDFREVKVARTIVEHARSVWLAADQTKFGRPAMVEVARLERVDALFTDAMPPPPFDSLVEAAGVRLHIAAE